MKRIFSIIGLIIVLTISSFSTQARPFYFKIKVGVLAKWGIYVGDCEPGWGLCVSLPDRVESNGFLGYDDQTDQMIIKVSKNSSAARDISDQLSLKEDSPIDPRVTDQVAKLRGKTVYIKAGTYKIITEGEYLLAYVDHYIK